MSARVEAARPTAPPKPPHVRRRAALHHRPAQPPPTFREVQVVQTVKAHDTKVVAVAWSPSGQFLATSDQRGTVKMFILLRDKGGMLRPGPVRTFHEHSGDIMHMAFSRTDFLLTASVDRTVRLWHADTNLCLRSFVHPDMVTAAAFHPLDENFVVSGGCDGVVRVWKPRNHACVAEVEVGGVVTAMEFSNDGANVFVGTFDGQVVVLDIKTVLEQGLHGKRKASARSSSESTDGSAVGSPTSSSGLDDHESTGVHTVPNDEDRNSATLQHRSVIDTRHHRRARRRAPGAKVAGLALDAAHNEVIAAGSDSRVHIMDGSKSGEVTSRLKAVLRRKQEATSVKLCASLSPDGRFLLLDAVGPYVRVMDLQHARAEANRGKKKEVAVGFENVYVEGANVSCACFATEKAIEIAMPGAKGHVIVVGGDDGRIRIVQNVEQ